MIGAQFAANPLIGSRPIQCLIAGSDIVYIVGGRRSEVGRGGDQSVDSAED